MTLQITHKLDDKWSLWIRRHEERSWDIKTYQNAFSFNTIEDYWGLHNTIYKICDMTFIMKDGIKPVFEDDKNRNGGQLTFLVPLKQSMPTWHSLGAHILTNNFCNDMEKINGFSVSLKGNKALFKIWFNNYEDFSYNLNNKRIVFKFKNEFFKRFRIKKNI